MSNTNYSEDLKVKPSKIKPKLGSISNTRQTTHHGQLMALLNG